MSERFSAAYDALLARWPAGTAELTVPTPYGPTRVHAYGPPDGEPLVLLHGGGATGTVWYANAPALGARHRLYAVDILGDAGRSLRAGRPLRDAADLADWLGTVLDGLGLPTAALCGHSYGAWLAVTFARRSPQRVTRLALLDPTQVFGGFRPGYLLRALPTLLRPTAARVRRYLAWETEGSTPDRGWSELYVLGAIDRPGGRPVTGRRADPGGLTVPALVLFAGRSRAHDAQALTVRARRRLPHAEVDMLPGLTHHAIPTAAPAELDRRLLVFLAREHPGG
ncbi:alpha/beta fold hydrolase [Kitasatospora sp. NPDC096147]|uniref:alpha/beta fold hydrolase n=1 Tax=Kitasatospora sp. NPDC096147 TaxID=3364093 RepID=UPI0037FA7C2B